MASSFLTNIRGFEVKIHSCFFSDWCLQDEVGPIFPANTSERLPSPEVLTKFFLDKVLDCMSTQVCNEIQN